MMIDSVQLSNGNGARAYKKKGVRGSWGVRPNLRNCKINDIYVERCRTYIFHYFRGNV